MLAVTAAALSYSASPDDALGDTSGLDFSAANRRILFELGEQRAQDGLKLAGDPPMAKRKPPRADGSRRLERRFFLRSELYSSTTPEISVSPVMLRPTTPASFTTMSTPSTKLALLLLSRTT